MHETDFDLAPAFDSHHTEFWPARIEDTFDLVSLEQFATGYRGVTRLVCGADDAPDWVVTCAWDRNALVVEAVEGFTGCEGDERRESRWQTRLPFGVLPRPFRSWPRMTAAAESASSCESEPQLGDWWYSHALIADGHKQVAKWSRINEEQNRRQGELVSAYGWVWVMSWCRSKIRFL